jgi:hypothetical protein
VRSWWPFLLCILLSGGVEFQQFCSLLIRFPRNESAAFAVQGVLLNLVWSGVPATLLLRPRFLSWLVRWQLVVHANPPPLEHSLTGGASDLAAKAPHPVCVCGGGSLTFA